VVIAGVFELCAGPGGSGTILTAVAPGASALRWSTGATTAGLLVTQPGTYSVAATFANGCVSTATQLVAVPAVRLRGDSLLCAGRSLTLSAEAPGATAYAWSNGATTASTQITQPGTYTVQALFAAGCTRTAHLRVQALAAVPPFALGPDTVVCAGQFLTLRVPTIVQGPGYTYEWSTGARSLALVVREPGTYSLRVSSACETRSFEQTVVMGPCLIIPNIITPNHDQLNDRFVIKGLAGNNWTLELFNRWGTRVYSTSAYANEWGTDAAAGQYYYLLRQAGTTTAYKGWVEVRK
jgi:gliding motility-associated-like protein